MDVRSDDIEYTGVQLHICDIEPQGRSQATDLEFRNLDKALV